MHAEGPWTCSKQEGTPGHCFQAQVWGADGHSLAVIEPTKEEAVATDTARGMAAVPEFMEAAAMMTAAEDSGGDMWWEGFKKLKAAFKKAGGEFPSMDQS